MLRPSCKTESNHSSTVAMEHCLISVNEMGTLSNTFNEICCCLITLMH